MFKMTHRKIQSTTIRQLFSYSQRSSLFYTSNNFTSIHLVRQLTSNTSPRLSQKPRPERKHVQKHASRDRSQGADNEISFAPSVNSRTPPQTKRQSKPLSRRRRRRRPRPEIIKQFVLPEMGLSPDQLAALTDTTVSNILKHANELSDSSYDNMTLLPPTVIELITEELNLPVKFSPQIVPLSSDEAPTTSHVHRRMPVVTVMGHVDHGKTSLLDGLRESNVAQKEIGGITQSVAAFRVQIQNKDSQNDTKQDQRFATFIDTPGHAAFKEMRANGALATDLVVLVVAADDGVMPQTIEAARLARSANVPIIVAINKCDLPGADPERVRYELLDKLELNTEQLGGDIQCVEISAKTKQNLPDLLEAIMAEAEVLDLGTDPSANASGVCMESRVDKALGSIATVVVKNGTLKMGDIVVFQSPKALHGNLFGKVRSLVTSDMQRVKEAGPGIAVGIIGIKEPIPPGSEICVMPSEKLAKATSAKMIANNTEAMGTIEQANDILKDQKEKELLSGEAEGKLSTTGKEDGDMTQYSDEEKRRSLIILVKGDVKGSADAVAQCIRGLHTPEIPIKIIGADVGDVNDIDVRIASVTHKNKKNDDKTIIVAFNVRMKDSIVKVAKREKLDIISHSLIYHLEDELKEIVEKMKIENDGIEKVIGKAEVMRIFEDGKIAGCSIADGVVTVGDMTKVMRFPKGDDSEMIREAVFEGEIESIKHFAKPIKSAKKGTECGLSLVGWEDFKSGDQIECIIIEKTR